MQADQGLTVVEADRGRALTEFIRFPVRLYRNSEFYVPHLEIERKGFFNPRKNPFFAHAEVALFLVRSKSGETLGRISAHIDRRYNDYHNDRTGFFGFFDTVDNPEAAALLLKTAEDFLRKRNVDRIMGPMNFTTNDEVGILVKGFDSLPFLMMTYNFPYYSALLEKCGYEKAKDLFAYHYDHSDNRGETPAFVRKLSARARKSTRITLRHMDMKNFAQDLKLVKLIYNGAWKDNWGFVPMTEEQIDYLSKDLKPLANPALIYFAFVENEPAAFFMALPDYNVLFKDMGGRLFPFGIFRLLFMKKRIRRLRVLTMGVVEQFRHLGVELFFFDELFKRGPEEGISSGEISWVLEDNYMMNRIASRFSGKPYRTYRIYDKKL